MKYMCTVLYEYIGGKREKIWECMVQGAWDGCNFNTMLQNYG